MGRLYKYISVLRKQNGGISCIAVGNILRGLVVRTTVRINSLSAAAMLQPFQLGFVIEQGCKATTQAARALMANLTDLNALIKLDLYSAVNLMRGDSVYPAVYLFFPFLYAFIQLCYSGTFKLLFDEREIDFISFLHSCLAIMEVRCFVAGTAESPL